MKKAIKFTFIALLIIALVGGLVLWPLTGSIVLVVMLVVIGMYDLFQKKHTILRNFPVIGHIRYLLEMISPELHQYFVESDMEGRPIHREFRSLIYRRAKGINDTKPFGTKADVYSIGYECMIHSIYPKK